MPKTEGKLEKITGWVYNVVKKRMEMTQAEVVFEDGTSRREWLQGDLREYVGRRISYGG